MKKIIILFLIINTCYGQKEVSFYFDFNQSIFNGNQISEFENWVKENESVTITKILGYCDWVGNNPYNDSLSLKRATYIKDLIVSYGLGVNIDTNVEIKGIGKKFKQSKNQNENRKVTLTYWVNENSLTQKILKAKKGETVKLENLYFYNNSGELRPESFPTLEELLDVMNNYTELKIEIQGHICCQEKGDINQTGLLRALAIYNHLLTNGIDKDRLNYKSFEGSKPVYKIPEANEEQRNANRRVEIEILEN